MRSQVWYNMLGRKEGRAIRKDGLFCSLFLGLGEVDFEFVEKVAGLKRGGGGCVCASPLPSPLSLPSSSYPRLDSRVLSERWRRSISRERRER